MSEHDSMVGKHVYVTCINDLGMSAELAHLAGKICRVVGETKGGLYEVVEEGRLRKYSVPKKSLEQIDTRPVLDRVAHEVLQRQA